MRARRVAFWFVGALLARECALAQDAPPAPKPALGFEWEDAFEGVDRSRLAPGAYSRVLTPFKNWTLICDVLQGKKRVCFVEAASDKPGVSWRIAPAKGRGAMGLIILPADADPEKGLVATFNDLSKKIAPLLCDPAVCVATFPMTGALAGVIASSKDGKTSFFQKGVEISANVRLEGLSAALERISGEQTPSAPTRQRGAR